MAATDCIFGDIKTSNQHLSDIKCDYMVLAHGDFNGTN